MLTNYSPKRVHQVAFPPTLIEKGQFPHTFTRTEQSLFFQVPEKGVEVPDPQTPAPSEHGGRMELIKVGFLLPPGSPVGG